MVVDYRQSDKQKIAETFHVTKWAPDVHLAPDYNIAPSTVNRVGLFFIDKNALAPFMERLQKQAFKDTQSPPFRILHQRYLTPDLVILQAA